jgi:hypothetical protein
MDTLSQGLYSRVDEVIRAHKAEALLMTSGSSTAISELLARTEGLERALREIARAVEGIEHNGP